MAANSLKKLHSDLTDQKKAGLITDAGIGKGDGFSIDPELLLEEKDFNTRGAFFSGEDYFNTEKMKTHIRNLADAYKRGDYVPPIVVKVKDGKVFIRDGHCRRRGIALAKSEGAEIKSVRVVEQNGDESAQTLLIVTSNNGAPLSVLERAVVYSRLHHGYGWSIQEVAEKVGVTQVNIRTGLQLLEMPLALKQIVQQERVSASYALELFNAHGENAVEMVRAELQKKVDATEATTGGGEKKVKITKKDIDTSPRFSKKFVTNMHSGLVALSSRLATAKVTDKGTFMLELSADDMDLLNKVKAELAAKETPTENKKQQSLALSQS